MNPLSYAELNSDLENIIAINNSDDYDDNLFDFDFDYDPNDLYFELMNQSNL